MPSITFQPVLRDIKDVLNSDFYVIPRFQRPYSWNSENLEDFWRDVIVDNDEGYFVGPMVAYKEGTELLALVDGQQRITSITLALCALRDLFQGQQAQGLAGGIAKYIERDDDDSIAHFVLRSEGAGDFLKSQIQRPLPRQPVEPTTEEQKAVKRAHDDISAWMRKQIEGLSWEHEDGPDQSEAARRLRQIRDRILGLQVIWITIDNEDDAYVIFETLNSRGKDLETVDLLKNLLLAAIRAENGDLDTARAQWNDMREILATAGEGVNPNKFILHWWLSQNDYTAERKLFRAIKKQVSKDQATSLLENLGSDAKLYARIANPKSWDCSSFERPARDSLEALNLFGVRQPRPLLLALLRSYQAGTIKIAALKKALRSVEAYHFISTAVVGVSSTGGLSLMYARHAREISGASTPQDIHASLTKLAVKLHQSMSSRATFVSEFENSVYYASAKADKRRLVQYTLRNIHDYSRPHSALDHAKCNLEHISPQSKPEDWTAEIGNLLWIDSKLNQKLGNADFEKKKAILKQHDQTYDLEDVTSAQSWGGKEVRERTRRMAELAYDHVWRVK